MRQRFVCLFIAAELAAVGVRPASALAASPAELQLAAARLRDGRLLVQQGKHEAGCMKLEEAHALDSKASTLFEIAGCREKSGQRALSHRLATDALELAKVTKDRLTERQATVKLAALGTLVGTVIVTALEADVALTIDGAPVAATILGKPYALEPGDHAIAATAPGKLAYAVTVKLAAKEQQPIAIPALALAPAAAPIAQAPQVAAPVEVAPPDSATADRGSRFVLEIAGTGSILVTRFDRAPSVALDGLEYAIPTEGGGVIIASCGDTTTIVGAGECEGTFDSSAGAAFGARVFAGWAVNSGLHVGARGFAAAGRGGGVLVGGGPSVLGQLNNTLWLGLELLVGYEQHRAPLAGARGSVPAELALAAKGAEIDVPLGTARGREVSLDSGVLGGGALDLTLAVLGLGAPALLDAPADLGVFKGAVVLSVTPTVLASKRGLVVDVPLSLGFRFF
ncbi:MAG: hypothetical protein EXR75_11020 [Myxococcales bacterium]|nr:hypothetical protein [Myxococcales bacterium]